MNQRQIADGFVHSLRVVLSREVAKALRELLATTQNEPGRDGTLTGERWEALRAVTDRLESLILAVEKFEKMK